MRNITYRELVEDDLLRAEVERSARRERALVMRRFLEQSAKALFGEKREQPAAEELCATC